MAEDVDRSAEALHSRSRVRRVEARLDSLLTRQRVRIYPLLLLAAFLPALVASWFGFSDQVPLPDYVARWTGGRMLLEGKVPLLYDPAGQSQMQADQLGATHLSWFVSPPFVAGIFAPLAALPYPISAAVWTTISAGALVLSLHWLRPFARGAIAENWTVFVVICVASHPVLELLGSGQDTALLLLVMVAGLRLLVSGRDGWAGLALALVLMKPQLAFCIPILLIVQRRYVALLTFAVGALSLAVTSIALVGFRVARSWLFLPTESLYQQQVQQGQAWKGVSLQAWFTSVLPQSFAGSGHLIAVLLGLSLCYPAAVALRSAGGSRMVDGWAILLATTVVASPHFMVYDLVIAVPLVVLMARRHWSARTRVALAAAFVLLWLAPPLHLLAQHLRWPAAMVGAPWAALIFLLLWFRLVWPQPVLGRSVHRPG